MHTQSISPHPSTTHNLKNSTETFGIHGPPPPADPLLSSSYSNNSSSSSMAAREEGGSGREDVRRKRLVSNRESARRTRLRRKTQVEELETQNHHLAAANQKLTGQLIDLAQCINRFFQENTQLKEEVSLLQSVLAAANQNTFWMDDQLEENPRCSFFS